MADKDYPGRNYKKEYATYQGTAEQKHRRAMRNAARAEMVKRYGTAALAGKDVDHEKMLLHGGTNAPSNLRISSVRANRNWRLGKKGGWEE
jgi:hypothetical protein